MEMYLTDCKCASREQSTYPFMLNTETQTHKHTDTHTHDYVKQPLLDMNHPKRAVEHTCLVEEQNFPQAILSNQYS